MRPDLIAAAILSIAPAIAASTTTANAAISSAPDVVVYAEPTLKPLAEAVGAAYRARSGNPVRVFAAPSSMLLRQIPHTRDDVMILQGSDTIAAAIAGHAAANEPARSLGRNHLVVARRGPGGAQPLAGLEPAKAVALVDAPVPDALGALTHAALAGTGFPKAGATIFGVARGADAIFLLAAGEADLAALYSTDVAADPGLSVAAELPDPPQPIEVAALLSNDNNSVNARDFLAFLGSPDGVRMIRAAGLTGAAEPTTGPSK